MNRVFQVAMLIFWLAYFGIMYKLYLVMEAKIPEYIKTEVIRAR